MTLIVILYRTGFAGLGPIIGSGPTIGLGLKIGLGPTISRIRTLTVHAPLHIRAK